MKRFNSIHENCEYQFNPKNGAMYFVNASAQKRVFVGSFEEEKGAKNFSKFYDFK